MSNTPQLGAPAQPVPIAMKQPSIMPRPVLAPGMLPLMPPFFNPGGAAGAPRGMPLLPANMAGMAGMASLAGMGAMGGMVGMQARIAAMAAAAKAAGGPSMPQGVVGMNAFSAVLPQKAKLGNIAPRPAGMSRQPLIAPPTKAGGSASGAKRPRLTSKERLERSRERNRIHARKTRQRKKMVMTQMQDQLKTLHEAGLKLRQAISERKTANILLSMSSVPDSEMPEFPVPIEFRPEDLQQVKNEDLDRLAGNQDDDDDDDDDGDEGGGGSGDDSASGDGSGSEDGQPTGRGAKRRRSDDGDSSAPLNDDDETNPELTEKNRRERNRMHAKRTRVRKKHIMDETSKMIERLEKQNGQLVEYLTVLEGRKPSGKTSSRLATPEPGLGPEKASSLTNGRVQREWSPTSAGIAGMLASLSS